MAQDNDIITRVSVMCKTQLSDYCFFSFIMNFYDILFYKIYELSILFKIKIKIFVKVFFLFSTLNCQGQKKIHTCEKINFEIFDRVARLSTIVLKL